MTKESEKRRVEIILEFETLRQSERFALETYLESLNKENLERRN